MERFDDAALVGIGDWLPCLAFVERARRQDFVDELATAANKSRHANWRQPVGADAIPIGSIPPDPSIEAPSSPPAKSPLEIMSPQETRQLSPAIVPSSPSYGPPLGRESSVSSIPPAVPPLERYLQNSERYEKLVTGASSPLSDINEPEVNVEISRWIEDVAIVCRSPEKESPSRSSHDPLWSSPGPSDESAEVKENVTPEPRDPLHVFLQETQSNHLLAYQLQASDRSNEPVSSTSLAGHATPPRRTIELFTEDIPSPDSGESSISVDSGIDEAMSEQVIRFGPLNQTLATLGFGRLEFHRADYRVPGKRRQYKPARARDRKKLRREEQ